MSILDKVEEIKQRVKSLVDESRKQDWIDEREHKEILQRLQTENVTIGVVGQIKYGKSTLLNALIFGNNFLPVAATPMTASLSYITYGDVEIEVEFYTPEEWKDIEKLSKEKDDSVEVKAAQEVVENSSIIRTEFPTLLGKKRKIKFSELQNYVSEGGRYVPVTKSLSIKWPSERLKGFEIVDTPGFNDPIASREVRAKELLSKADVVLVLLYAQRPFDVTDKKIIFDKIRTVGTGKVVIVVNKYDLLLNDHGAEEKVINYIKEKLEDEVSKIEREDPIIGNIFKNAQVIPFSSLMALLGKMEIKDIQQDKNLDWKFNNLKHEYPALKTQSDFLKLSKLSELEKAIDDIIKKDKLKILVQKPIAFITGKAKKKRNQIEKKLYGLEMEEKGLNRKKSELEQEQTALKKVKMECNDKVGKAVNDLEEYIKKERNKEVTSIRDKKNQLLKDLGKIVPEKDLLEMAKSYNMKCQGKIESELINFENEMGQKIESFRREVYDKLKEIVNELDIEIGGIISTHLEYSSDVIRKLMEKFLKILDEKIEDSVGDYRISLDLGGFLFWGTSKEEVISNAREKIEIKLSDQKISEGFISITDKGEDCIKFIEESFGDNVITPIANAFENAIRNFDNKKRRLEEIEKEKEEYEKAKSKLNSKIEIFEKEAQQLMEATV